MPEIGLQFTKYVEEKEYAQLEKWAEDNQVPRRSYHVTMYDGMHLREGRLFHIEGDPLILLEGQFFYDSKKGGPYEAKLIFTESQRPLLFELAQAGVLPREIETKLSAQKHLS